MEMVHFSTSSMFKSATGNLYDQIRRRDGDSLTSKCGSDVKDIYDTSAHVYALFLILVLSTMACGFPLLSRKISKNAGSSTFIFLSQHFGTGVLIATAFVHLLPTAFTSLTHPCLASFFSNYTPLAGLIAMTSTLFVVGLEMYLTLRGLGHSHSHTEHYSRSEGGKHISSKSLTSRRNPNKDLSLSLTQRNSSLYDLDASEGLMANLTPLPTSTPVFSPQITANSKIHYDYDSEIYDEEMDHSTTHVFPQHEMMDEALHEDNQSSGISSEVKIKRKILQCLMLEAGILFHSIFIGMALSVATGPPFVIFLVAIGFHQSFEGMALGSRIAAIEFPSRSLRPWLMILAYGITTPIGQGVGIAMHNMYDPESAAGLLIVGIMNGVSSGLLLYAGLVQLLAEDFLSHKSYKLLNGTQRVKAFCSVVAGAFLMALVGAWA